MVRVTGATLTSRNQAQAASAVAMRRNAFMIPKTSDGPAEFAETARKRSGKVVTMIAVALALGVIAASAKTKTVDVVPVADLNFRFADCQPQERTYDLKKYSTIYYGASIVCQLNVAYISYDRKYRYQSG